MTDFTAIVAVAEKFAPKAGWDTKEKRTYTGARRKTVAMVGERKYLLAAGDGFALLTNAAGVSYIVTAETARPRKLTDAVAMYVVANSKKVAAKKAAPAKPAPKAKAAAPKEKPVDIKPAVKKLATRTGVSKATVGRMVKEELARDAAVKSKTAPKLAGFTYTPADEQVDAEYTFDANTDWSIQVSKVKGGFQYLVSQMIYKKGKSDAINFLGEFLKLADAARYVRDNAKPTPPKPTDRKPAAKKATESAPAKKVPAAKARAEAAKAAAVPLTPEQAKAKLIADVIEKKLPQTALVTDLLAAIDCPPARYPSLLKRHAKWTGDVDTMVMNEGPWEIVKGQRGYAVRNGTAIYGYKGVALGQLIAKDMAIILREMVNRQMDTSEFLIAGTLPTPSKPSKKATPAAAAKSTEKTPAAKVKKAVTEGKPVSRKGGLDAKTMADLERASMSAKPKTTEQMVAENLAAAELAKKENDLLLDKWRAALDRKRAAEAAEREAARIELEKQLTPAQKRAMKRDAAKEMRKVA